MTEEEQLRAAQGRIADLESDIAGLRRDLEGHGDDCVDRDEVESPAEAVGGWLERQVGLGLISPEGRAVVELLLEDLS